jgi:hypothetical protein
VNKPLRYVAAGSAYLAPPLLLLSDILLDPFISEPGLLVQRIALIRVHAGAIRGRPCSHDRRASGQMGGRCGARVLGALAIVIRQGFLAAPIRPPRCCFPSVSGLVWRNDWHNRFARVAALIAASALLFPLAHMSGAPVALIGGDVLLLAAFWSLAKR